MQTDKAGHARVSRWMCSMKDRGSSSRLIILCGLMTFCFLTVALLIGIERAVHMHFEEQLADLHSTVDEMRNEISLVVSKQERVVRSVDQDCTCSKGEVGMKGEKGDPSFWISKGHPGPPGTKGSKGDEGLPGQRGPRGKHGRGGAPGDKGDMGVPGVKGTKGEPGAKVPSYATFLKLVLSLDVNKASDYSYDDDTDIKDWEVDPSSQNSSVGYLKDGSITVTVSNTYHIHCMLRVQQNSSLALLPLEQSPPLQVKSHMLTLQQRINTRQLALLSDDSPIVLS
ncbi:uncharacterized protein LOC134179622 [Corticium candelabrum]|uniref:uncharacterized protein LOC134179622 n=1 Tax=Corticium candelabrum TaxID=121492 RepID=UPI002E25DB4B|nr:uncharacterized protein LOC134179622 [Corticium candelabrum]